MAPLIGRVEDEGDDVLLDTKKYPPALELTSQSLKYEASLCTYMTMSLA